MAFATDEFLAKVREFADRAVPDADVKERYELGENDRWVLHRRRAALGGIVDPALVRPLHFRPFDRRVIYDETNLVGDRRERLRGHLERVVGNIALITARSATPEAPYCFVSRSPGDLEQAVARVFRHRVQRRIRGHATPDVWFEVG